MMPTPEDGKSKQSVDEIIAAARAGANNAPENKPENPEPELENKSEELAPGPAPTPEPAPEPEAAPAPEPKVAASAKLPSSVMAEQRAGRAVLARHSASNAGKK